jgi:hypothetical protein
MGGGLSIALVLRNGVPAVTLREAFSALLMLKNVGDQLLRFVLDRLSVCLSVFWQYCSRFALSHGLQTRQGQSAHGNSAHRHP